MTDAQLSNSESTTTTKPTTTTTIYMNKTSMIMEPWPQHNVGLQRDNDSSYMNPRIVDTRPRNTADDADNGAGNGAGNGVDTLLPLMRRPGRKHKSNLSSSMMSMSISKPKPETIKRVSDSDEDDGALQRQGAEGTLGMGMGMDAMKVNNDRSIISPMAGTRSMSMSILPVHDGSRSSRSAQTPQGQGITCQFPASGPGADANANAVDDDEDDDPSIATTNITLELRKAAKKTIRHAKSKRAIHALVPLEVKKSMLEKEFPHVRGSSNSKSNKPWQTTTTTTAMPYGGAGSVNSMRAEQSVADSVSLLSCTDRSADLSMALDKAFDERDFESETDTAIDYDNCIQTLTPQEIRHLRSAMHSYEKQRVTTMMEHLSGQMQEFHQLLEENQALKLELTEVKKEKDGKISDLEDTLIDMKLNLAQCQGREDHHRLSMAKCELDLKVANEENHAMKQKLGIPPCTSKCTEEEGDGDGARRNSCPLTKSMNSAEDPDVNVRSGEPPPRRNSLLTRSWFGGGLGQGGLGGSFLDRSSKRDIVSSSLSPSHPNSHNNNVNNNNANNNKKSPNQKDARAGHQRPHPPSSPKQVAIPARSRSFVDPKKAREKARAHARASKESNFMPWNSCDNFNDHDDNNCNNERPRHNHMNMNPPMRNYNNSKHPVNINKPTRSQSFVDPKKARRNQLNELMIGSDLILPVPIGRQRNDNTNNEDDTDNDNDGGFDSRATFLSNITDVTFEDADTTMAEEIQKTLFKESLLAGSGSGNKSKSSGITNGSGGDYNDGYNKLPSVISGGSYARSELTFEPAKPVLQHAMSLHTAGVHTTSGSEMSFGKPQHLQSGLERQMSLREAQTDRNLNLQQQQQAVSFRGIPSERPQLQQHTKGLQGDIEQHKDRHNENERPKMQTAATLRGRNKGKKSSAGDAYLAFC